MCRGKNGFLNHIDNNPGILDGQRRLPLLRTLLQNRLDFRGDHRYNCLRLHGELLFSLRRNFLKNLWLLSQKEVLFSILLTSYRG